MNAREVRCGVSGYEGRKKRERGSVKWDTLDLVRRNLGAGSVMEFASMVGSGISLRALCEEAASMLYRCPGRGSISRTRFCRFRAVSRPQADPTRMATVLGARVRRVVEAVAGVRHSRPADRY